VRNLHRLRALERKLGRPAEQVPRGLVIIDADAAEVCPFGYGQVRSTLVRSKSDEDAHGHNESADDFERRVAKAAEQIPALVMSRAEYEEIEARLLREVQGLERAADPFEDYACASGCPRA
jgi:hypothetical protein